LWLTRRARRQRRKGAVAVVDGVSDRTWVDQRSLMAAGAAAAHAMHRCMLAWPCTAPARVHIYVASCVICYMYHILSVAPATPWATCY
jgi:hypothetical protein